MNEPPHMIPVDRLPSLTDLQLLKNRKTPCRLGVFLFFKYIPYTSLINIINVMKIAIIQLCIYEHRFISFLTL